MKLMGSRIWIAVVGLTLLVMTTLVTIGIEIAEPNFKAHWLYIGAIAAAWAVAISYLRRLWKMFNGRGSVLTADSRAEKPNRDIRLRIGIPVISAGVTFQIIAWLLSLDEGLKTAILILSFALVSIGGTLMILPLASAGRAGLSDGR